MGRVDITSIGHQFDWHRSVLEDLNVNLFHSIRLVCPYDPLTKKMSPTDIQHGSQCRGIFLGENTLEIALTWEHLRDESRSRMRNLVQRGWL